jgi:cell division protein FtsB
MSLNEAMGINLDKLDFGDQKSITVAFSHLLNLIESLYKENVDLKEENQKLKDEINRLKGEKGKPKFKSKSAALKDNTSTTKPQRKKARNRQKLTK